jgi:hypothetical protein
MIAHRDSVVPCMTSNVSLSRRALDRGFYGFIRAEEVW